ncbi:MAG: SsrA-binding protein SmpB [Lentisphaeria bacterium]
MASDNEKHPIDIAKNKKAWHDYAVLEQFEAGIALTGTEVKSCRNAGMSLSESYAQVVEGELLLLGANIAGYSQGNRNNHNPKRARKLLMHHREIFRLKKSIEAKGLTLVPLFAYFNKRGLVKISLGLCRGKNVHDKREVLKEKADTREIRRMTGKY